MSLAVLALGSNLRDQEANLRKALAGLADRLVEVSGSYWAPPWGDPDRSEYLNAVAIVDDDLVPADRWLESPMSLRKPRGDSVIRNLGSGCARWMLT